MKRNPSVQSGVHRVQAAKLTEATLRDLAKTELELPIHAAKEPGAYEIRYVMKGKRVIARRPITVVATAEP